MSNADKNPIAGSSKQNDWAENAQNVSFKDVVGINKILDDNSEVWETIKNWSKDSRHRPRPHGLLICGPRGSGKSLLARAIATVTYMFTNFFHHIECLAANMKNELINICYSIFLQEIGFSLIVTNFNDKFAQGDRASEVFQQAKEASPCVLVVDNIESSNFLATDISYPMVSNLSFNVENLDSRVMVIGTTDREDLVDGKLRGANRFDRVITLGLPTRSARAKILRSIPDLLKLEDSFDFNAIAELTSGYVPLDLIKLARDSESIAIRRAQRERSTSNQSIVVSKENRSIASSSSTSSAKEGDSSVVDIADGQIVVTTDDFKKSIKLSGRYAKRRSSIPIPERFISSPISSGEIARFKHWYDYLKPHLTQQVNTYC